LLSGPGDVAVNPDALWLFDASKRGESNDELDDGNAECEATVLGRGAFVAWCCVAGFKTGGTEMTALSKDDLGSSLRVDVAASSSFSC
jgi:hypothetical protein